MRRFYISMLIFVFVQLNVSAQDNLLIPLCTELPIIDGKMDACWMNLHRYYIQKKVNNPNYQIDNNWDLSASFKVCYNCRGDLYFWVEVTDDIIVAPDDDWRNDGILFALDYNNSKYSSEDGSDSDDVLYLMTFDKGNIHSTYNSEYCFHQTSNGYLLEAVLYRENYFPLGGFNIHGEKLGFDIEILDNDSDHINAELRWWSSADTLLKEDPSLWGEAELLHCNDNYVSDVLGVLYLQDPVQLDCVHDLESYYSYSMNFTTTLSDNKTITLNSDDLSFNFSPYYFGYNLGPEGLYLYVEVKDDSVVQSSQDFYQNDAIEFFLQYRGRSDTLTDQFQWAYGQNNQENVDIAWEKTSKGYNAEILIYQDALSFKHIDLGQYGLEIEVVDNDPGEEPTIGHWYSETIGVRDNLKDLGPLESASLTGDCPCETGTDIDPQMIHTFTLSSNYPNPFNPHTTISYTLSAPSRVALRIFDITGREVEQVLNERQGPGTHQVVFDAGHLPSGMYVYELKAGSQVERRKMTLLK